MGNTSSPPEPSHEQENVTTSASTMKKILSDEHVAMDPKSHNTQFPYPQPQNHYPNQYPAFVSNQPQQAFRQNVYSANNAYPPSQPAINPQLQQMQPVSSTHNLVSAPNNMNNSQSNLNYHPTARQLEFQLEQQMQQLRLLQKAQQLERQRLELAKQQRDLDAQKASQEQQQNELIRRQQQQEQQERQRAHEATAKAAALARAQALQQTQERQAAAKEQEERERNIAQCEKYSVVYHWTHGGRDVYVAYSGDNWSQKYRMQRSHNDFSLIMEINPGVYHYKFIVDNQWRCALDQKLVRDANGAYTNVLHVRSHSYQQVIDEQKKKRKREKQKAQYQYTQNLPKSDHYVQDPSVCPIHLHKVILNNDEEEDETDAGDLGNDESGMNMKKKSKSNVNTMELPKPLRVSLNHLYVSDRREEEVVTLGMTERYRDKFFTTVYYTPMMETGVNYEDGNYY